MPAYLRDAQVGHEDAILNLIGGLSAKMRGQSFEENAISLQLMEQARAEHG